MKKIVISAFVAMFAMGVFTACQSGMQEASAVVGNYTGAITTNYLGSLDGAIPSTTEDPYTISINMNPLKPGDFFVGVVTFEVSGVVIPAINLPCSITEVAAGSYEIVGNGLLSKLVIQGHEVSALDVSGTIAPDGTLTLNLEYRAASDLLAEPIVTAQFIGTK